ncbi:MAG: rhamnogalacturonan lyase [Candidatus Gastranaerophilales bacterium]|nr:rhamnogalacturonan lyase [Candidatus Gastranaerophilales bacterium]
MELKIVTLEDGFVEIGWEAVSGADKYRVLWSDVDREGVKYCGMTVTKELSYTLRKATHVPHFIKVEALCGEKVTAQSGLLRTPVKKVFHRQLERLNRGLQAVPVENGIFLSWRMFLEEVDGYDKTGLTGTDYKVYRNDEEIALVTDSTNYLDRQGQKNDRYSVAPIRQGQEGEKCDAVLPWDKEYLDIPIKKPADGVTPAGEAYTYRANDMSVADVDGDGEYEYIVKWDPSNSQDVSIKGYTGKCYLDCYKLDGRLLWRLDMGVNIRAGAHYTQFIVYDFNGDGKAEMAVKTAPGTQMTTYDQAGSVKEQFYITLPARDVAAGVTHQDNYVCSREGYRQHMTQVFEGWREHPEVKAGHWPDTLEECFGLEPKYTYPLSHEDAAALVDYFIKEYAPSRSPKNELDKFEGFIYEGPEYLTMFAGDGKELQTIPFKMERVDDGLMWGDYAMKRIEPCNRVDRFLSGVAYLDGERPYLLICRGYYTRSTIVAYDFFENQFREYFSIDSGFVPMANPFCDDFVHGNDGTDPVYGILAGQGNHSLSTADVDGDGCMEIIYGAATIDHDGSVLYSSQDYRPDGVRAKLGHGDAMHVAKIDPDRPGLQIFNVFEGGAAVPYGYALRDAESGEVLFGEYATTDLGRCMIGKITNDVRGLQVWVNEVYDCAGNKLEVPVLGTNQSIRWAGDLTTQVIDSPQYIGTVQTGVINDNMHGEMLVPEGTMTNNGTKGNPCLIADIFGDFREEILLRTEDSSAIRIYMNTEVTDHKLFTLMHDTQYRCGVAWQNNCYNQPGYTSFYYGSDMDFGDVLPEKFH